MLMTLKPPNMDFPVFHTECVIEGQKRVANSSFWKDSDDDCVTCTCNVSWTGISTILNIYFQYIFFPFIIFTETLLTGTEHFICTVCLL